jgi:hypothetical protein
MRSLLLASTALLAACTTAQGPTEPQSAASTPGSAAAQAVTAAGQRAAVAEKNAELARFFEAYDQAQLDLSPEGKAYRGIKDEDYGRWGEFTDAAALASRNLDVTTLANLRSRFDRASLSPDDQLSYDLFENMVDRRGGIFPYRENGYVFDQMNGAQSEGPAFLINITASTISPTPKPMSGACKGSTPRSTRRSPKPRTARPRACCRPNGSILM